MTLSQPMLTQGTPISFQHGRVADAMHPGVLTCTLDTPLRAVARMMATYRVHAIVVWGEPDEEIDVGLWGVVSDLDLVAVASTASVDDRTAGRSAVTPAVMVAPDETLERAAQLMVEHRTAHLVVVDPKTMRPVGILSTLDLARVLTVAPPAR